MWARNALFIGLVMGGLLALTGSLFPPHFAPPAEPAGSADAERSEYQDAVQQINEIYRKEWQKDSVQPAGRAADLAIVRRMALGLVGTVPSLEEIRHFEADPSPERLRHYLDRLLADRRSADYFAERLARVYVGTEEGPFIVYRRRRFVSWLSDELHRNRPYDQIVHELIAGKGLWTDNPATNFITVTVEPDRKGPNPERLAARTARAFLGVRLDCAQCHNHPFQPWLQKDFHGLAAYFGQAHQGFTGIYDGDGEYRYDKYKTGDAQVVEPRLPEALHPDLVSSEGARREKLASWVTNPKNPLLPRATVNRMWALMLGRPLFEPVDDLASKHADSGSSLEEQVLQTLADDFVAHGFDLQRLLRVIASTDVFQGDSALPHEVTKDELLRVEKSWAVFPITRLRPEQVVGSIMQACSIQTNNQESHILVRIFRILGEKEFVQRYGDTGEDEFVDRSGTIPQRLLMMNGNLVHDQIKESPFLYTAASRISQLAPDDQSAVEAAFLTILTRRPSEQEPGYFEDRLRGSKGDERKRRLTDLYWSLINSTEFSWNH